MENHRLFLSYGRPEAEIVLRIKAALEAEGYAV